MLGGLAGAVLAGQVLESRWVRGTAHAVWGGGGEWMLRTACAQPGSITNLPPGLHTNAAPSTSTTAP